MGVMGNVIDELRQIATSFQQAKVLLAAAELGLFDRLKDGGASAQDIATMLGADLRGVEVLLDALVALDLAVKRDGVYRNRPDLEGVLTEDAPSHFVASLRHSNRLFRNWAFLEERVRGEPVPVAAFAGGMSEREHEDFIRAMYAITHATAASVVDAIPLQGVRSVADIAGGPGHYLVEFLKRSATLRGYLVDLPLTLDVAARIHADHPEWSRVGTVVWDVYRDDAPADLPPLDLAFVSQLVHSESPDANRAFLRRLFPVMSAGGRVVIHERTVDPDRTSPREGALFAVNMLAMTTAGRTYTEDEIVAWGREAGFEPIGGVRLSERSHLVSFRRPG